MKIKIIILRRTGIEAFKATSNALKAFDMFKFFFCEHQ